jgi:RNA polymerase sigma-70 factor, ECF subfamily
MTAPDAQAEEKRRRFEETALPFLRAIHSVAWRLTHDAEEARDLVQETCLRAYRTFEGFRAGTNCKAWLLTILYSIFVNRYRKKRRQPRTISIEELEKQFPTRVESAPSDRLSDRLWSDREVEEALAALPEDFRSAVLLVDVGELTYEEAAAALACPVGTVRSRLFRARKALFVSLQDYARRAGYPRPTRTP